MDNVCHTLTGAALARAGLRRRTRHAGATLMIAANLPDIDVLVFATDLPAIAVRRGWTHGVLAQVLLPLALVAILAFVARRRASRPGEPPFHLGWTLALAYLGMASHVFLDFLNSYGVRLLAPFDWRWFYGDAVFIIDLWLWIVLGLGVLVARRRGTPGAARIAIAVAAVYIGVMLASSAAARTAVSSAWQAQAGTPPRAVMVGPLPVTPFRREVILDTGPAYRTGTIGWPGGELRLDPDPIPKGETAPEVARAREASPDIRGFLVWSRFPFWERELVPGGTRVTVSDARFMATGARFAQSVTLPRAGPGPPRGP